jgi:hypothetical protein
MTIFSRRQFAAVLASAAAWPITARAQQRESVRRIGVLSGFAVDDPEAQGRIAAFRQGMQEQGWSEGRNLQIEYRWAGPDAGRIAHPCATPRSADRQNFLAGRVGKH